MTESVSQYRGVPPLALIASMASYKRTRALAVMIADHTLLLQTGGTPTKLYSMNPQKYRYESGIGFLAKNLSWVVHIIFSPFWPNFPYRELSINLYIVRLAPTANCFFPYMSST